MRDTSRIRDIGDEVSVLTVGSGRTRCHIVYGAHAGGWLGLACSGSGKAAPDEATVERARRRWAESRSRL